MERRAKINPRWLEMRGPQPPWAEPPKPFLFQLLPGESVTDDPFSSVCWRQRRELDVYTQFALNLYHCESLNPPLLDLNFHCHAAYNSEFVWNNKPRPRWHGCAVIGRTERTSRCSRTLVWRWLIGAAQEYLTNYKPRLGVSPFVPTFFFRGSNLKM